MLLTDEDVGRNVRDLRVERKMTQAVLAGHLYLDRTAVSRLETGQRAVTAPELAAIAGVLGVEIGYLATTGEFGTSETAIRVTAERPMYVEASRPHRAQIPALRSDLLAALYSISTPARSLHAGLRRAVDEPGDLTRRAGYLGSEFVRTAVEVVVLIAIWALVLAVWFSLFNVMLNFQDRSGVSALGAGDAALTLPAILLGASLTGGAAHLLSRGVRGWGSDLVAHIQIQRAKREFQSQPRANQTAGFWR